MLLTLLPTTAPMSAPARVRPLPEELSPEQPERTAKPRERLKSERSLVTFIVLFLRLRTKIHYFSFAISINRLNSFG